MEKVRSKCYMCNTVLTEKNISDEHIIINAAGGRLKSKNLLCGKCNSNFGEGIDAKLAVELNHMANLLMVKRQSGTPPPIEGIQTVTGEKYKIKAGGKPVLANPKFEKKKKEGGENISITARNDRELKKMLSSLAKKYPDFNVEEALKLAERKSEYLENSIKIKLQVGGPDVFRATCKCAINFYLFKGGERNQIEHLIPYIQSEKDADCVWMHYQDDLYNLHRDECIHILHLVGNSKENTLYCYVDYFNCYKYLVLLSDQYNGENMRETYCLDVLNSKEVSKSVKIDYNRVTLLNFFSNKDYEPFNQVKKAIGHTLNLSLRRQDKKVREELIGKAIKNSLGTHKEATTVTKEMLDEYIGEFEKEITPYLVHKMKSRNKE